MISKKGYFNFLILMLLVTTYLPVVANNLPPIVGSFHFYILLFAASILIFETKTLTHKNLIFSFLVFGIILLLLPNIVWVSMDDWNVRSIRLEVYFIASALLMYYYFWVKQDFYTYAKFIHIALIFIAITLILTQYAAYVDPLYARKVTGEASEDWVDAMFFYRLGAGGYGTAIAIMGLIPFIVYYFKNANLVKYPRYIILIFGVLVLAGLIRMQFFGNILIGFVILLLSQLSRRQWKNSLFLLALFFLIAIIIPVESYANLLVYIGGFFDPSSNVYLKFNDMAHFIVSGEDTTVTASRSARYPELLEAFANSPWFGTFFKGRELYEGGGAHLFWMNKLTVMGLLGFALVVYVYYKNIKHYLSQIIKEDLKVIYYLSVFAIIGYGLIKNIAGREVYLMLFFIIPGLQYLPLLKSLSKNAS